MLDKLYDILLSEKLQELIVQPNGWSSLIINRRKPYTYRIFRQFGDLRLCLHKFDICDEHEAFRHPHPWPGAFRVLDGEYKMGLWLSKDRFDNEPTKVAETILRTGSSYEITNPLTWHSVVPLHETYTIMINSTPWNSETAHTSVRTTKGKDLDSLSETELKEQLKKFNNLLAFL